MKDYYDARAPEYDDWYLGLGRFKDVDRPGWDDAVRQLERLLASLPPRRTLDVACGTAFLTRHLRGEITAMDQSAQMLAIAGARLPGATLVQGDAIPLPFEDDSFERVLTGHFYGHLAEPERAAFLSEARRVARELIIVDSAASGGQLRGRAREEWQERILNDGSSFTVYKRYFDGAGLATELGGGKVLLDGRWFVVVSSIH